MSSSSSHQTQNEAGVPASFQSPTPDGQLAVRVSSGAPEAHLLRLCEATVGLLASGGDHASVLSNVLPSLVHVFGAASPQLMHRLRSDLNAWSAASQQLKQMASLHCGADAAVLVKKLDRTHKLGSQIIDSLAALESLRPPALRTPEQKPAASPRRTGAIPPPRPVTASLEPPGEFEGYEPDKTPSGSDFAARGRAADLYQQAERQYLTHNIEAAERGYTEALLLDPAFRPAYVGRGRVRLLRGAAVLAVADFTAALKINSSDPIVSALRGDAHALCGSFEAAVDDYSCALVAKPKLTRVRYNRAVALRGAGQLDRAMVELDELIQRRPTHGPFYLNRGLIWLARGDLLRAAREFRTALRYQPDSEEGRDRLAEIEAQLPAGFSVESIDPIPAVEPEPEPRRASRRRKKAHREARRAKPAAQTQAAPRRAAPPEAAPTRKPRSKPQKADPLSDDVAISALDEIPATEPEVAAAPAAAAQSSSAGITVILPGSLLATPTLSQVAMPAAASPPATPAGASLALLTGQNSGRQNPGGQTPGSGVHNMPFRCPACAHVALVGWDRLQPGRIMACPRCRKSYVTKPDGKLAPVVRNAAGKWAEDRTRFGFDRATLRRWGTGSVVAALLVFVVSLSPKLMGGWSRPEAPLPKTLEERSRAFGWAWLRGDFRLMRRLTETKRHDELLEWYKTHPVPVVSDPNTLEEEVVAKVEILPGATSATSVRVTFLGLSVANVTDYVFPITWEEKDKDWYFDPAGQ